MEDSFEAQGNQTGRGKNDMIKWAQMLSISSRGIGFNLAASVCYGVSYSRILGIPDIYALYRVSLAALEAKLRRVMEAFPANSRFMEHVAHLQVDPNFESTNRRIQLPKLLRKLIDSVGILQVNDVTYLPVFSADRHDTKGHFIPRAENVIFSNLRRTVVALASPRTPLLYRMNFEQANAIPGAIWMDNVLMNASEIIPELYSPDDLDRDARLLTPWLNTLQTLVPNLVSENVTFSTTGTKAMLLCNSPNGLRIPHRIINEDMELYVRRMMPIGNIKLFFSPVDLVIEKQFDGVNCLLGERTQYTALQLPLGVHRLEAVCPFEVAWVDWISAMPLSSCLENLLDD